MSLILQAPGAKMPIEYQRGCCEEEEASQVLPNLLIPCETQLLVELHCKINGLSSANSQLLKKSLQIVSDGATDPPSSYE